jgi:hypothetical protein
MLLDLLEQLLDACLQFGRQGQEQHRPALDDFVEPIYQLFQKVHEQYLENFKEYRATLAAPGAFSAKAEDLCARLSADNRFSADQEAKVILFMDAARQQLTSYVSDDAQIGFITGLCSYLSRAFTEVSGTQYTGDTLHVRSPVFRNRLTGQIKKIVAEAALNEERKQAAAVRVLDGIVAELRSGFAAVTESYQTVRAKMTR